MIFITQNAKQRQGRKEVTMNACVIRKEDERDELARGWNIACSHKSYFANEERLDLDSREIQLEIAS